MKKRILSLGLAVVLTLSMSFTAFAAESSTTKSNSSQGVTVEKAKPGQNVKAQSVTVAVVAQDGSVRAVTLPQVVNEVTTTIVASAKTPVTAVATVESILTAPATEFFTKTVAALAEIKGSNMVVNNMGTIKTTATAKDAFGNVIASVGVVENVTSQALVLLMSVNDDGTVEYVEGVVDPVTGAVVGAFKGIPSVITVLVLA